MSLVVGTDLSELSHEALRAAVAIAGRRGDRELFLVTVLDDEASREASDVVRGELVAAARARLEAAAATAAAAIKVKTEVLIGPADESLMAFADSESADLVLVTAQGQTHAKQRHLGVISEKLAIRASRPLLVVRDAGPLVAWAAGERPLRVMIGIDESAATDGAIQFAKAMRKIGPVDLVVGHVYFPDETAARYGLRHVSMVEPSPELERLLTRDLTRRLGEVPGEGQVVISPRLGLGRIGDHLLGIADAHQVDMIMVGTRRKAGLKRLSSVSAVILHDARQSVLCVPLSPDTALDDVPVIKVAVVATDRSAFGNRAIPYAYALVGDRGEVHIIHVVDDDSDTEDASVVSELLELAPPSRMGVTTRAHVIRGDDPARTIAEAAERLGGDVVCIASHGRSGLTRALVGSVADKLMRACHRPVLVLRPVE